MSLQRMAQGYFGSEAEVFESVSPEVAAKYDLDNGSVVIAMECAGLLNEAFMEGVYAVNDIEISAAMEGLQSVQESSDKMEKIKAGLKNAGSKIADVFIKLGEFISGTFANIVNHMTKTDKAVEKFFSSIPSNVSSFEYEGYKYTHLDEITDILMDQSTDKTINVVVNSCSDMNKDELAENFAKVFDPMKQKFGVDDDGSVSDALFSYFRNGAGRKDSGSKVSMSVSEASGIVSGTAKFAKGMGKFVSQVKKDYGNYAKTCKQGNSNKQDGTEFTEFWSAAAKYSREMSTFTVNIAKAWQVARYEAIGKWTSAIKAAVKGTTAAKEGE